MIKLVTKPHPATGGQMVEIFDDDTFLAAVYPHLDGIRIVSKYLDGIRHEHEQPPALVVGISREDEDGLRNSPSA